MKKFLKKALSQETTMRSITGISIRQFFELSIFIHQELLSKKNIKRSSEGGRNHTLKNIEEKIFFILFYLKVYPTYDSASILCLVDKSQICKWVKSLLPVLEIGLGRSNSLPKRKISSITEFKEASPKIYEVIINTTERKSCRPSSSKALKRRCSGKKKSHTRKNSVIVDKEKHIRFLSPNREGRKHDLTLLKKEALTSYIPTGTNLLVDKGYGGLQNLVNPKVFVHISKKHKRKVPFTKEECIENQLINSIRIPVEHAIGRIKRFGCMQVPVRNKDWNIENQLPVLCAGLWNFHLDRR